MRIEAGFVSNQELSRVVFYPLTLLCGLFFMEFVLRSTRKAMEEHGIN